MTEQERQLIQGLATRIQNAPPPQVDHEADELIRRSITRPDALYLLIQTVLIQDMALNQAKAQIDDLKQRTAAPGPASGFLPGESGARPAQPGDWGRDTHLQQPPPQPAQYQGGYQPPPPSPQSSGAFGSFLRSAATTAAGVIAGETAFSALSSIFGHHGGYGGGSGFLSGGPISPGSETIINNYYDDRDRGDDPGNDRQDDHSAGDDDIRSIDDQDDQGDQDDQSYDDDVDDSSDDSGSDVDDSSDDDGSVDV